MSMLRLDRHTLPSISGLLMRSRVRFAVPIILVGVFKILGSVWTYNKSLQDGIFGTPWMNLWGPIEPRWLYLFMAWDTSWYVSMAQSLSFSLDRTFFPGYPFLIRIFGYVSGNFWLSAFLISMILGFVSLPIFQAIAECYMTKGEALGSTIVMSFFPYIFLFTTVAYSESLFLFAVLISWYFHLKDKALLSSLCSLLAVLSKTFGVLIVLPILLDNLIRRKWKDALLTSIPVFIMVAVMISFIHKGLVNRLVLELNAATWQVSRVTFGNYWFRDFVVPIFTSARPISFFHYFHAYALAFIVLIGYFAISSYKIDWKLAVYSIAMFALIILFGYTNGIIRYTSFIFPIWLNVKIKNILVLIPILLLFYIHCLVLWHQFLWAPYPM